MSEERIEAAADAAIAETEAAGAAVSAETAAEAAELAIASAATAAAMAEAGAASRVEEAEEAIEEIVEENEAWRTALAEQAAVLDRRMTELETSSQTNLSWIQQSLTQLATELESLRPPPPSERSLEAPASNDTGPSDGPQAEPEPEPSPAPTRRRRGVWI